MKTVLEFENEEEYLKWESIRGNEITTIQDSDGIIIGELKEQETMFIEDPNGNCMEIKTMKNPNTLFEK